jgi:hypothetical protein
MNTLQSPYGYEIPPTVEPGLQEVTHVTPQPEVSWDPSKQRVYDIISRIVEEDEEDDTKPTVH